MILNLLENVCTKLEAVDIPYMLTGSLAMNIYTVPRMTRDVDIVIDLKYDDADDFFGLFSSGYYLFKDGIKAEIRRQGMFNVVDYNSGEKIDFIIRKNTEFHIQEFKRRRRTEVFGFKAWVVTAEDLIISKIKWMQDLESETQKRDVVNLLSISGINQEYVKTWCDKLNLNTYNLI
ncbi:MAG: hypothetical protein GVY08_00460 [Bacteroidetes bacterium]|jgi:hypothetical protein|nr:hypothetical protein [Bacteroidota bacterium]